MVASLPDVVTGGIVALLTLLVLASILPSALTLMFRINYHLNRQPLLPLLLHKTKFASELLD